MNLYDLHTNPEELHGFDNVMINAPKIAFDLAVKRPDLRPRLEPTIMKNGNSAYWYSYIVLKRRPWPEAEPYIMKDPGGACHYAKYILKRRWPEAEPYIMKDPELWEKYKKHFMT